MFLIFLNLRKAYDTMDRDRLIQTLEGYGSIPRLCVLLETFWAHQKVVPRHNGYHVPSFLATQGTTQGGLASPTLFNAVVYNTIWIWMDMTV